MIASANAAVLCDSLSSTRWAMRVQLSRLRADCEVSCEKRSSRRMASRHRVASERRQGGVGYGVVDDLWGIGEMDAGDTGESEEVGFIRVGTGTDKAGDAGGDSPLVDGGVSLVLDEGYGGEDGVAGGGLDEAKEGVCELHTRMSLNWGCMDPGRLNPQTEVRDIWQCSACREPIGKTNPAHRGRAASRIDLNWENGTVEDIEY
ncbi:hypothetical protein EDB92DRAFT_2105045 [Lactarius akahatsu]|uniref:Uncharacterized protein n=1 Tax=Lactarius akahatsu TaxID=416441 RepID=A0AAD4QBG9_9AGAM|nr:hypothetical protein EDB92DRAFT_2105045 [Lactarius akahatsu]